MSRWIERANRNTLWASLFVEELHRGGVECACISPGSRSTPLALALAHHAGFENYAVLDERSAGYFALGMAKASGRPVALVCTSGTAAVNLHPAVVEADRSRVPLILLTADRPPLLRDTGAGQTIDQLKLYGGAVRWFHEVGEPVPREEDLRRLRGLAARAIFESMGVPAGPVHLNFAFRKPLEAQPVPEDFPPALAMAALAMEGLPEAPYSQAHLPVPVAAPQVLETVARKVRETPKGLILCGPMNVPPHIEAAGNAGGTGWPDALALLARRTGYPILAEPPSGVACGSHDTSRVIAHGEAVLQCAAFREKLSPGLILRFGEMPTNKHIEVLLNEHSACPVILINESGAWLEPTHHPTELIPADPARFCGGLAELLKDHHPVGEWLGAFWEADRLAAQTIEEMYRTAPLEGLAGEWFEGRVFTELADLLPEGAIQYTASSMPVRDLAAFTPVTAKRVRHLVNRGANGIDGTISSALGAAAAAKRKGEGPVVLVTGDLAFFHDSNGLLIARQYELPLVVVLINNDGGGIFEMLPIAQYGDAYERFFGTPHGIDFSSLCSAYGISHQVPADWDAFRAVVSKALSGEGPVVIEVRTERNYNRVQHDRVWQAVSERIEAAFPPDRRL